MGGRHVLSRKEPANLSDRKSTWRVTESTIISGRIWPVNAPIHINENGKEEELVRRDDREDYGGRGGADQGFSRQM